MTPTPAYAGTTATRRRSRIVVVFCALVAAMALVLAPAVAHAESTPQPSPTAESTGVAELSVAALANGIYTPGSTLSTTYALSNGTAVRVSGGEATLQLGSPLDSADAVDAWLAGESTIASEAALGTATLDSVAPGAVVDGGIIVESDAAPLQNLGSGVYQLRLTVGELEARSVLVIAAEVATSVGVIVPITAGTSTRGLLTSNQLSELTAADGTLTAVLDAVAGTDAILAIDPAIPAAIRVLGSAVPASAAAWLERLMALPNERFALQFGDADVVTQLQSGLDAPLQPTSLVSFIDTESIIASPAPTSSPSSTAEPTSTDPVAPTLEELLAIGSSPAPTVYWPATGTATADVVTRLQQATPESTTLLSSADANGATSVRATTGGASVVLFDSAVSTALGAASSATQIAPRAAALAEASARLSFARGGSSPLLVAIDRVAIGNRTSLRSAITAATALPGTSPASLSALLTAPAGDAQISDAEVDAARADTVTTLRADADAIARFASVLDDPALLTGAERASILQLLGNAWLSDPNAWATAIAEHRQGTMETLQAVQILPSSPLNLLTAGTNLRFWVKNDLPYPVNVVLYSVPNDLRLEVERETVVSAAAPSSNTPVEVPVRARIGNGSVTIDLSLRSPSFEPIGGHQSVEVNVHADWESIGIALMSVLVVGFLSLGVIRTIRRRRAKSTGDTDTYATDTAGADDAKDSV